MGGTNMNYKKHIGDGKLPNRYWVFHYDEKFTMNEDSELESTADITETKNSLVGEFKTYKEALQCVDTKTYLPHVVIEDRITGVVFESQVIVCSKCGHEEYDTIEDIRYTKESMEKKGIEFK
jgi:uncharacterized protein (DUF1330 family)